MSFSSQGLRVSFVLIFLFGFFFFFNKKPKFLLPFSFFNKKRWFFSVFLSLILFFSVLLLPLRFSFIRDKQIVVEKDVPIQIIFDVSLSMAATDIEPSRFIAAKKSLIELVDKLDWYYISLLVFSGKPFIYIPFSSDSSSIISKLETMNLWDFPPVPDFLWTAIGDALLLGVSNVEYFSNQEIYNPWIVILITDGDSNVGFDPLQVLSYYQKIGVSLFVLWVGKENYVIGRDSWNTNIVTDINVSLLQNLAKKTGWKFYRVLWENSFDVFFEEIIEDVFIYQQEKVQYTFWELNTYILYIIFCWLTIKIMSTIIILTIKRGG